MRRPALSAWAGRLLQRLVQAKREGYAGQVLRRRRCGIRSSAHPRFHHSSESKLRERCAVQFGCVTDELQNSRHIPPGDVGQDMVPMDIANLISKVWTVRVQEVWTLSNVPKSDREASSIEPG